MKLANWSQLVDPYAICSLIVIFTLLLLMTIGFLQAVWMFAAYYIFPVFGKIFGNAAKTTVVAAKSTVVGTISLNKKFKRFATFGVVGILLSLIFIIFGIVYGSKLPQSEAVKVTPADNGAQAARKSAK